jgi:hypothetical protein
MDVISQISPSQCLKSSGNKKVSGPYGSRSAIGTSMAQSISIHIQQSNDSVRLKAEEILALGDQFKAKYTNIAGGVATTEIFAIQISQAICECVSIPYKEQIFET